MRWSVGMRMVIRRTVRKGVMREGLEGGVHFLREKRGWLGGLEVWGIN